MKERAWALESDRPGFESCFSHCINQLRLNYAVVTNKSRILVAAIAKVYFSLILHINYGSAAALFHVVFISRPRLKEQPLSGKLVSRKKEKIP